MRSQVLVAATMMAIGTASAARGQTIPPNLGAPGGIYNYYAPAPSPSPDSIADFVSTNMAKSLPGNGVAALPLVAGALHGGNAFIPGPSAYEYVPGFLRAWYDKGLNYKTGSQFTIAGAKSVGTAIGVGVLLSSALGARADDVRLNSAIGAASNYIGSKVGVLLTGTALTTKALLASTGLGAAQMGAASLIATYDKDAPSIEKALDTGPAV